MTQEGPDDRHIILPCLAIVLLAAAAAVAQNNETGAVSTPPAAGAPVQVNDPPVELTEPQKQPEPLELEQIQGALSVLKDLNPQLAKSIESWTERDLEKVSDLLRPQWHLLVNLWFLKKIDPLMYNFRVQDIKLDRESRDLADQFKKAIAADEPSEARVLRVKMAKRAADHFRVRQAMREEEVRRLRERVERMAERLARRKESMAQLVELRVSSLTGEDKDLDW